VNTGASKAFAEGKMASMQLLNIAADFLEREGWRNMRESLAPEELRSTWMPWLGFDGGHEKWRTGSHVETDYFALLGGVAREFADHNGVLTAGVFLEGGWGDGSTYNSFATGSIDGDADTDYFGGGFMLKKEQTNGIYYEGSMRVGRAKADFSAPVEMKADTSSLYFGTHLGLGRAVKRKNGDALDTYLRVFYTRQNSDSLLTGAGEQLHLDSAYSLRARLGARYEMPIGEKASWYAGAAVEHEFSGALGASLDGVRVDRTDPRGFSGLVEVGYSVKTSKRWTLDLAALGMFGKRQGIGGSLSFNYKF
jgi:outer membrane autotransporter protein